MTTSRELAALDTNVLIYALYADAEHPKAARLLVDQERSPNAALCFTPQVLAEFYAVVTIPTASPRPSPLKPRLTPLPPSSPCLVSYFYHVPLT